MLKHNLLVVLCFFAAAVLAAAVPAWAAGQARLELVGDPQAAATAFQEWGQALSNAGLRNVRIRAATGSDKLGIDVQGTPQSPLYVVTGIIRSRDEVLLPNGRYRRSDVKQLAHWLDDLAQNGPPDRRPAKVAYGLTKEQLAQVQEDLAQTVGFETKGQPRGEVIAKLGRRLRLPLASDAGVGRAAGDDQVAEDLSELSCGTALACVLRPAGYCLVPQSSGQKPGYAIVKARPELAIWPVGWEPTGGKTAKDVLPAIHEFLNVDIQQVPATQAIEAIAGRLKVPVLMDHNAMARHGIDPAKKIVSVPPGRTTYAIALRKLLFQAGLKYEVRLDEAEKPFLWISTVKPV